ncbi:MAG: anthranilate phosphoribosyltransferase [Planctomycetales bacterium]|nr:anthranilate phosphoribosyltransferase [Planctomycetales bacterium]NIM08346.1 anthranilate phosphoribosyltransferase [Planctomycetales bacterium]NIN07820.1 anthranilate phosphoribosyltransferase [Planctomycetales bacterium]NIN76946.1 anthranilate phosphoribosyltransferase [Planctomycetales bacterium]NIO34133.1 anthranilate phosphoribosyltransferase [Planctomycetales bacterium]
MLEDAIGQVLAGHDLPMEDMADAIDAVMEGRCTDAEVAVLLTALRGKGESVSEVAGAALAMRRHMTPIRTQRTQLVDTCGTGGDASGTFNISTAAALVTAAAGVAVAKHGNRSITSKTGSADVLEALGVNIEAEVPIIERCLDELGFCFCFAPRMHPSMRNVAAVRRKLAVPTIFNLLGPLCNPASAPYQLLGVGRPEVRELMADALLLLGTQRALVVSGADGLDEVTLNGATHVIEATDRQSREFRWSPADFGLQESSLETIRVEDPQASAAMVRDVLNGKTGVARDIVLLNAAAALWTAGQSDSLRQCAALAADAIDCGRAAQLLGQLVTLTQA